MHRLKDLKVVLGILLVLSWLVAAGGGFFYHTIKTNQLEEKDLKIASLETSLEQIGELVTAYTVTSDTEMGKEILDTDIQSIQVPISMATNLIQNSEEIIGKHYRLDLAEGTALSPALIYEEELTDDLRLFDVVLNTIPVGIKEGSYVDVRISLPLGEDFIAMAHKKVHSINGGVLKLAVTEHDIHSYNSMLVDSLLYPGTNMYAIEYMEGGVQQAADTYYPISTNVIPIAQRDPNLLQAVKTNILTQRESLEKGLNGRGIKDEDVDTTLEAGRELYRSSFVEAEQDLKVRLELQKQADASAGTGEAPAEGGGVTILE